MRLTIKKESEEIELLFQPFNWYLAKRKDTGEKVIIFVNTLQANSYCTIFDYWGASHSPLDYVKQKYKPLEEIYNRIELIIHKHPIFPPNQGKKK